MLHEGSAPVTDAFTSLQADIATYGAAAVGLVVAGVAIVFGIKWLKRGAGKA